MSDGILGGISNYRRRNSRNRRKFNELLFEIWDTAKMK